MLAVVGVVFDTVQIPLWERCGSYLDFVLLLFVFGGVVPPLVGWGSVVCVDLSVVPVLEIFLWGLVGECFWESGEEILCLKALGI